MKLEYIRTNPCDTADLPRVKKREIKPLTDEEIPMFLSEIEKSKMRNAFAVCLFTGMREGELLGLSWDNVDFDREEILVCQQLQRGKEKGSQYYIMDTTKNGISRNIKPPSITFDYLRHEWIRQQNHRKNAGSAWENQWNLVFTNEAGRHLAIHSFYKEFKKIANLIGRPDARPHDLRHTCATTAIAAGADIKSVQSLMGHATASFTLDRYAHTSERMRQDTANRLQDFYANLPAV